MKERIERRRFRALALFAGAVALATFVLMASAAAATPTTDPGWYWMGGGTLGCAGPGAPDTATGSLDQYIRGDYPFDVFSEDDPSPPNPPFDANPPYNRYIDRIDVSNDCVDAFEMQARLSDGTVIRGIVLPGVHRTLYQRDLAALGIRLSLREEATWGTGYPAPPPPWDFIIAP